MLLSPSHGGGQLQAKDISAHPSAVGTVGSSCGVAVTVFVQRLDFLNSVI